MMKDLYIKNKRILLFDFDGTNASIVKENRKIRSLTFITLNPGKQEEIPHLILLPYVKPVIRNTIKVI